MRSYNRFIVDQEIECIVGDKRETILLYNLSSGGCMIETANADSKIDTTVQLQLQDIATIAGRIVWQVEKNVGIKFETLLHHKVVEHFGFSPSQEEFDEDDPRDRFGIPLVGYAQIDELLPQIGSA